MMSLIFGLFTRVSGSGPLGPLVISIFLYACESWTLTAELENRAQSFEMRSTGGC